MFPRISYTYEIVQQRERLSLLTSAIKAHNNNTRNASTGQGTDRHLMALRLVMNPGETVALFQDELFSRSQEWKLSTSGLSSGDRFIGTGYGIPHFPPSSLANIPHRFGSPYIDGYGINCGCL